LVAARQTRGGRHPGRPAAPRRGHAPPPARPAPTATRQASATAPSQTQARTAVGAPPRPSASAPAARDPAQYLHGFVRMVQAGAGRRADQTWWSCWSTEGARAARRAGPALMLSLVSGRPSAVADRHRLGPAGPPDPRPSRWIGPGAAMRGGVGWPARRARRRPGGRSGPGCPTARRSEAAGRPAGGREDPLKVRLELDRVAGQAFPLLFRLHTRCDPVVVA